MDDLTDLNKPADPEASVPGHAGPGRRSFLKLGAVPATLTLISQPARAWHCNSTSAWGSALINTNASVTARNSKNLVGDECPSVSQWVNNNYNGASLWPMVDSSSNCKQVGTFDTAITLGTVLKTSNYASWPSGLSSTSTLYAALQCATNKSGTYTFQQCLIVAMLNNQCYGGVSTCTTDTKGNQLAAMVNGSYAQPGTTKVWQQSDIMQYLDHNYIAYTGQTPGW